MAFDFGTMMKSMGGNFMKNMAGKGGGSTPLLNSAGEDISAGFGPQGGGGGSVQDIIGKLGSLFGGGNDKPPEYAPPPNTSGLAQMLASMSQQGGSVLSAPDSPTAPGYRMDPNQPVFGRRRFGFGGY